MSDGALPTLTASDFASHSGLPDWGKSFIASMADKYTKSAWDGYQTSIDALATAPANTENTRKASEVQYTTDLQKNLADASRKAAFTGAATGTTNSSVGTDYISALAADAVKSATAQQTENVAAADANYQNLVDTATATQAFSSVLADYLSKTNESYGVDFGGLDFVPGDTLDVGEGDGTWSADTGLSSGTYGSKHQGVYGIQWSPPGEFTEVEDLGDDKLKMSYGGQSFTYDTTTGEVSGISDYAPGEISAGDMATTSGLGDEAGKAISDTFDQYGTSALDAQQTATSNLSNAGTGIDAAGAKLNSQYNGLSSTTMALLKSALGTAGSPAAASDYIGAGNAAITDAANIGKISNANASTGWVGNTKTKNLTDSVNAQKSLATNIGDFLGLSKYSYDPGMTDYLSYYTASQANIPTEGK
jgi:hypothetical protein